jgi:ammonium transporter
MTPSRRLLLLPFVAACAFLLCGTAAPQDEPKGGKEPKQKEKAAPVADDKQVAELKQSLAATEKKLEALEKANTDLKKSADAAAEAAKAAKLAADQAKTGVEAAAKTFATKDELAALPKADAGAEETKKAIKEAKKAGTDADAKAVVGQQRGDSAWLLTSSAFVMFMVPGLALFYAGMVRRKNVLATMMHSMAALAVVGVYWVVVGYGLAFGPSAIKIDLMGVEQGGLIGWSPKLFFLQGVENGDMLPAYNIPVYVHVMFQGMFAILTPALISGAVAERIRFWPFCIFMILWVTLVYCPLAHMVWAFDWFNDTPVDEKLGLGGSAIGLLGKMGALDFAGGTVVHIAAGMAGLACVLVLRRRDGYPKTVTHPNSMVLTLLGAGLLWFGWFGFNGGSALNSAGLAGSAFAATQAAAAAAGLGWMVIEWLHKGKPTALGLASGIVAGLVAVTPASGFVYIWGGVAIGVAAAVVCYLAVWVKGKLGYDDSLDAFGVHGVGGFVGAVLTGVFCYQAINSVGFDGYFAVKGSTAARVKELETDLIPAAKKEGEAKAEDLKKYEEELGKKKEIVEKGAFNQTIVQLKAAGFSVVFAFVLSLALALLVQAMTLGNFTTTKKEEVEGLDRTEHGEVGFDFGYATETVSVAPLEPRAASAPKGNGRFELAVEGVDPTELRKVWTSLCQPTDTPADTDFLAVYPHVTTIGGGRFRFRGGDPSVVAGRLESLLKKQIPGKPVKVARL